MKDTLKLGFVFLIFGLIFIQSIPMQTVPVEQEKVVEESSEVDVEIKPTTEEVETKDVEKDTVKPKEEKQEVVEVTKPKEDTQEVADDSEIVSEVTDLEVAEMIVKDVMEQGYEDMYSVAIEDIGIMVLLYSDSFTEYEYYNAMDVDREINKALRNNGYGDVLNATVVVDMNTNEVYFTVTRGQILN